MANMNFKANLLPATNQNYNLGSSSQQWNVHGSIYSNGIYGTPDIDYGDTLPTSATEGQIFFQTSSTVVYSVPSGGTAGYALVKNSDANGDFDWQPIQAEIDTMSISEIKEGTNTASRTMRADYIKSALSTLGGSGLTFTHNSTNGIVLDHTNNVTAKSSFASTNTALSAENGTITVTDIQYDTEGHITSSQDRTITVTVTTAPYAITASYALSSATATYSTTADYATTANYANTAGFVSLNDLIIGEKSYNGSTTVTIALTDLGLSSAMSFKGITDTPLTDEATTIPINIISGGVTGNLTPTNGDVVLQKDDQIEFVYTGTEWRKLGLASSYSLANHIHGNILNNGIIGDTTNIGANDALVVTDYSDQHKLIRTNIVFDGSTTNQVLAKSGEWVTVNVTTAPHAVTAGYALSALTATRATTAGYATTANNVAGIVPIAHGGTGASAVAAARANLGTWSLISDSYNTLMPANGTSNAWVKIGTANTSYGILPSQSGAAGSGHNYIGTSSWYWKYAYIDQIYGHLNGTVAETYTATITGGSAPDMVTPLQSAFNGATKDVGLTYLINNGNRSAAFGYFLGGSAYSTTATAYGGFYVCHYGVPRYVGISNGTWKTSQLWKAGDAVTGAVWNDYAEYRESLDTDFGYVVQENGDDTLQKTTKRLDHFAGVTSDTWGFAQGETKKAKTPIAVAGRVLVYPGEDRNKYQPGDCVCAGPEGKVYIMTREEIINWPDRIVGTVSCVPNYDEWGGGENADRPSVKVNGRIWIKVK